MPLIKLTQQQVDKTKPPDAGWHTFEVEKFTDDEAKNKESRNWVFECVIVDSTVGAQNKGRYGFARFNSKQPGRLVSDGFLPSIYQMSEAEFMSQNGGQGIDFDPEAIQGKQFYGKIVDDVYEGKIQKRLQEFAPTTRPPF